MFVGKLGLLGQRGKPGLLVGQRGRQARRVSRETPGIPATQENVAALVIPGLLAMRGHRGLQDGLVTRALLALGNLGSRGHKAILAPLGLPGKPGTPGLRGRLDTLATQGHQARVEEDGIFNLTFTQRRTLTQLGQICHPQRRSFLGVGEASIRLTCPNLRRLGLLS